MSNLQRILQSFCACSGQIISSYKSHLWFFPDTSRRTKESIAGIFDIPTTHRGPYLGTPIFTTCRKDKIQKKIEGWQIKYLSVADRITLIKSTSASIPIYAMQTTAKNMSTLGQVKPVVLGGDTAHHRHCHTIGSDTIYTPIAAGRTGPKNCPAYEHGLTYESSVETSTESHYSIG